MKAKMEHAEMIGYPFMVKVQDDGEFLLRDRTLRKDSKVSLDFLKSLSYE